MNLSYFLVIPKDVLLIFSQNFILCLIIYSIYCIILFLFLDSQIVSYSLYSWDLGFYKKIVILSQMLN